MIITGVLLHFIIITMGILFMGVLLDVHKRKINTLSQKIAILVFALIYIFAFVVQRRFGEEFYRKLYPLLVHLPLMISFSLLCEFSLKKVLFAFVTALTMVATPVAIMLALSRTFAVSSFMYLLVLIVTTVLLLYALHRFAAPSVHFVFTYHDKMWWLYLCIPVIYWIGSYASTNYVSFAESSPQLRTINLTLWLVVNVSYVLLFTLFNRLKTLHENEETMRVFAVRQEASQQMVNQLRLAQEQTIIYRHDIRHHLTLIRGLAEKKDIDKIKSYLLDVGADIDKLTPFHYCDNETTNLILSAFSLKAKKQGVLLQADFNLPKNLPINDTDLCSLLSNALENSIVATSLVEDTNLRKINIRGLVNDDKLLISIQNPYLGQLKMNGEFPASSINSVGHGFGIKSIVTIVDRYKGLYSIDTENNIFVLQLMLPIV